jgi:hypothetical protein
MWFLKKPAERFEIKKIYDKIVGRLQLSAHVVISATVGLFKISAK